MLPKARVLVVDDEAPVLELCRRILCDVYEVVCAPDGPTAIQLAKIHVPDLLLVDFKLPGMSGLETARRITAIVPEVAILVMTANHAIDNLLATVRFGVNGFLLKPFLPDDLRKTVKACLRKGLYFKRNARLRSLTPLLDLRTDQLADVDQARLFEVITQTVLHELKAEKVTLLYLDEEDRDIVVAVSRDESVEAQQGTTDAAGARAAYWRIKAGDLVTIARPEPVAAQGNGAGSQLSMSLQARGGVLGVLTAVKTVAPFTAGDREVLRLIATQGAIAIENAKLLKSLRQSYWNMVHVLAATVDLRDHPTRGHSERLAQFAISIAKRLELPAERLEHLKIAALLHDIGKIGIADGILRKRGDLTPEEYDAMKAHTLMGAKLLAMADFPPPVIEAVLLHHERFDGSGYPLGLRAEQIPLEARILAAADAFEGMTSERPYRAAMPVAWAVDELMRGRGGQFDPVVINALVACLHRGEIKPLAAWDDDARAASKIAN